VNSRRISFSFVFLILIATAFPFPISSQAQTANSPSAQGEKETLGKKIFYQRCSVCHLTPLRSRSTQGIAYGPLLRGFVRDAETEQRAAETIRNGKSTTMPGFQYGLRPEEIDDIIAYLKTYR
jgi:mono/diheme cytochrome c family protein